MSTTAKGSVVTAGWEDMRGAYGDEAWQRVLDHLTDEDRELVAAARYTARFPVAVDGRVFEALVATKFEGNRLIAERELRRGGGAQADAMLNGIFSVFARIASPRLAFKRAGSIISSVYDGTSSVTEEDADESGGIVHLHGLGESTFIAPWQCGWIEGALKHFGAASPRVTEESWEAGLDASDHLKYRVRF